LIVENWLFNDGLILRAHKKKFLDLWPKEEADFQRLKLNLDGQNGIGSTKFRLKKVANLW
jgi:hypothetical protein